MRGSNEQNSSRWEEVKDEEKLKHGDEKDRGWGDGREKWVAAGARWAARDGRESPITSLAGLLF